MAMGWDHRDGQQHVDAKPRSLSSSEVTQVSIPWRWEIISIGGCSEGVHIRQACECRIHCIENSEGEQPFLSIVHKCTAGHKELHSTQYCCVLVPPSTGKKTVSNTGVHDQLQRNATYVRWYGKRGIWMWTNYLNTRKIHRTWTCHVQQWPIPLVCSLISWVTNVPFEMYMKQKSTPWSRFSYEPLVLILAERFSWISHSVGQLPVTLIHKSNTFHNRPGNHTQETCDYEIRNANGSQTQESI